MSTEFFNDQWRIPSNENQNKVSNYSMSFDGTNQGINLGSNFPYPSRTNDPWSISFWIKPNSATSSGIIFSTYDVSALKGFYVILRTGGSNNDPLHVSSLMRAGSTGYSSVATSNPIAVGEWQHIAVAFNGSYAATLRGITIYVNGSPVSIYRIGSVATNGSLITSADKYIGQIENNSGYLTNCDLDQVTFFDYELSQDQVTQLGVEGYAFNFTGANSENINLGTTPFSFTQNLTVSFWAKFSQTATNSFLGKDNNTMTGGRNWMIYQVASQPGQISFWTTTDGATASGYQIITSNISINNNEWHHVVCINDYTNGTKQIYIDGSLDITNNEGATISTSSAMVQIGNRDTNPRYPYDGQMSNVAFFDTAFTASQVQTLYNNGKPGDISSLNPVAWYKLDDTATFNSGTSVWSIPDASTNSNTGASVGMNASNLVASNINGELIANPMATSPKPIAYYQLGDQSVDNGANYLVPNNSLSDYVFNFVNPSDGINGPSSNVFNFGTGDFTISMWFKINSFPSNPYLFDFRPTSSPSTDAPGVYISTATNQVSLFGGGTIIAGSAGKILAIGVWYNFVVKRTGNTFTTHYDGGSADQTGTSTVNFNTDLEVHIGSRYDNINGFDGEISNFQVFNTALPQIGSNSIETIYNNGSPLTSMSGFNSLQAWYKLDSSEIFNSTSTEWSVDNNAYPSVYQSSLDFNGSSNYIDTNGTVASNLDFSVSAWINPTSYGTAVLGTRGLASASTSNGITMNINSSGNLWARIFTETSNVFNLQTGGVIALNSWSHVAMTYDSSTKTLKSYLNGTEAGSMVGTDPSVASTADLDIGRASIGVLHGYFDGSISNVSIFNAELTGPQVQTIYNNGTPEASISHSPVSWWKLNNTTTGVQDSAGSNNGTNNGATEYAGFVNALAGESVGMDSSNLVVSDLQQTSGYSPYALDFDGVNDYLNCGNDSSLQITGAMTISYWVKGTSTLGAAGVGTLIDANNPGYLLGPNTTGTISFGIGLTSSSALFIPTTQQITTTEWHHIVGVYTPSVSMKIYIDGQLSKTETSNIPSSQYAGGNDFKIGYRPCCNIDGQISNVAIWNTDLSSSEITEIYNQGRPSNLHNFSGTAPVSWWQIGSNSSYNSGAWTCLDEIGTNNAVSAGSMTNNDIVDGVGYSASGLGTSSIDIKGDAPYSTANGLSENMDVLDRVTDVPS